MIITNVACAVGQSVSTIFTFHIFRIENFEIQQYEHIEGSIRFSFQTLIFDFFSIFKTKSTQKSISSSP
jgi:hypothetical protein